VNLTLKKENILRSRKFYLKKEKRLRVEQSMKKTRLLWRDKNLLLKQRSSRRFKFKLRRERSLLYKILRI